MYKLSVTDHFDAAHYIKDYEGKCSREHGHRWTVEVALEGKYLDRCNMLVDFKLVKEKLNMVIDGLDHYQLNEVLDEPNVTAEFLAKYIYKILIPLLADFKLTKVTVWESPDCGVEYSE